MLREVMRGLIPDEVLAPRRARTGTTGRLFARAMRSAGSDLIADVARNSRLAELGVIDPGAFGRGWRQWQDTQDGNLGVALFLTMQTELWTRTHDVRASVPNGHAGPGARILAGALS